MAEHAPEHWNAAQIREDHAAGIISKFAPPRPTVEGVPMEPMTTPSGFVTKDSGVREEYDSGMRRDTQAGKPAYTLLPRPYLRRWADLMTRGAEKYGRNNWQLANSPAELERFKDSAFRHLMQWLDSFETPETLRSQGMSEEDIEATFAEDHSVAVPFNLAAAEHVRARLKNAS